MCRVRTLVRPSYDGQTMMGKGIVVALATEIYSVTSSKVTMLKQRLESLLFLNHKKYRKNFLREYLRRASPSRGKGQRRPNPYSVLMCRVRTMVRPSYDGQSLMGKGFVVALATEICPVTASKQG